MSLCVLGKGLGWAGMEASAICVDLLSQWPASAVVSCISSPEGGWDGTRELPALYGAEDDLQ